MRIAVIGAGRWGRLHLAKLRRLPGVTVAAVVDVRAERARAAAGASARALVAIDHLPADLDGATVAVSVPALATVTAALLERGLHVLVEKPAAATAAQAAALCDLAWRNKRLLAVGFLERFNPALGSALEPARAHGQRLVARRIGPPGPAPAPLHLDWLIHDLDLAAHLLGPGLEVIGARAEDDEVAVRLAGSRGRGARLTASRRGRRVTRRLWLDGERIDLLNAGTDPLARQLAAFVAALRGEPAGCLARGEDALVALRLAEAVVALAPAAAA